MPTIQGCFPVQKPAKGSFRSAGRQSAILAKTLFTNRFPSPPQAGQTRGIRLGGSGFQMIKKGLRESPGFEVFSVAAGRSGAMHKCPGRYRPPGSGGRGAGTSQAIPQPAARICRRRLRSRRTGPMAGPQIDGGCVRELPRTNANTLATATRAALSKRSELTKLLANTFGGIGLIRAQFPSLQPDEAEHIFFVARQVAKRPDTGRTVRRSFRVGRWFVSFMTSAVAFRLSRQNFKRQNFKRPTFKTPCHVTLDRQP